MRNLKSLFLAIVMMFSIVFIGESISSNGNLSANAQTVRNRGKKRGIIRRSYRGGRWVVRKTWNGSKWVYRRVWVASKWTGKTIWKNGKRVAVKSKKVVY